jgi:hypothetical protein
MPSTIDGPSLSGWEVLVVAVAAGLTREKKEVGAEKRGEVGRAMEVGRMEVEDAGVVEVVVVESEGTKEEEGPLASPKRSAVEDVETLEVVAAREDPAVGCC